MTQDPFNEEWEQIVRKMYSNVPAADLDRLIYQAKRTRLDPVVRQIYATVRNVTIRGKNGAPDRKEPRTTIDTTIDGMRLVAQRTAEYRGQTKPEWCGDDGQWVDVWLQKKPPSAARVGVHRKEFVEPCYGVVLFSSFADIYQGKPQNMWADMPEHMLAKVAEAHALRKAFPHELSGIYTEEEMAAQSREDVEDKPQRARGPHNQPPVDDKAILDQLANARATPEGFIRTVKHVAHDLARLPEKLRGVTWKMLLAFASDAKVTEKQVRAAMAEAKEEAAREKETEAPKGDVQHNRDQTFSFGPSRGVALREMEMRHLAVYLEIARKSLLDPAKARYKTANQEQYDTVLAEIGIREAELKTAAEETPGRESDPLDEDLPESLADGGSSAADGDSGLFDFGDD